jgi:AraC-like DNA-binding protein
MEQLRTGTFFGTTNETVHLDFCTITNTEYTLDKVDWHYHENAYFTFVLQGKLLECNRKETYHCTAGSLLFHNWQDPHYNIKPPGYTRGFHIEIKKDWFEANDFAHARLEGSSSLEHPDIKILFHQLYRETKIISSDSDVFIQQILSQVLSGIGNNSKTYKNPSWVPKLRDMLHEQYAEKLTLEVLSKELSIHPVHLCRDFSKYFHCTLGHYIRKLRVESALVLLADERRSLTDIALECGFSDQSHFLRSFKALNNIKPSHFRKAILG